MATLGVVFGLHWIIPNGRSAPGNSPMAPGLVDPAPVPSIGLTNELGLETTVATCTTPAAGRAGLTTRSPAPNDRAAVPTRATLRRLRRITARAPPCERRLQVERAGPTPGSPPGGSTIGTDPIPMIPSLRCPTPPGAQCDLDRHQHAHRDLVDAWRRGGSGRRGDRGGRPLLPAPGPGAVGRRRRRGHRPHPARLE